MILPLLFSIATSTAPAPRIDLLIMGRGGALYSVYGHSALRVVHPDGRDMAYNFGGVDITVPFFWVSLMRGRIKTYLEVTKYSDLLLQYSGEDRTIRGFTLRLTPEQARGIVKRLDAIYDSPDRYYFYHHVLDNCSTRVAKVLDAELGGALSLQSTERVRGTYRDWIIERVRDRPWLYLAMDLTGNGMGDVPITRWDAQFLPDGLERIVDKAKIDGEPFAAARYQDYKSLNFDEPVIWDWPWTKVYILFLVPLLAVAWRFPRFALAVWGVMGTLLGLMYIGFWLFSDYTFFWANWNLANFPPTHLLLLVGRPAWRPMYLYAHGAVLALVFILWWAGAIVQAIGPMLAISIPMTAMLLLFRLTRPTW